MSRDTNLATLTKAQTALQRRRQQPADDMKNFMMSYTAMALLIAAFIVVQSSGTPADFVKALPFVAGVLLLLGRIRYALSDYPQLSPSDRTSVDAAVRILSQKGKPLNPWPANEKETEQGIKEEIRRLSAN